MKSLLLLFSFLIPLVSFSQNVEVDTIANTHLADFSKIVHYIPKKLVVGNAPEKWKNHPVNTIASLLALFDNADRFSENDRVWAKAATERLAEAFFNENKPVLLSGYGYSGGPDSRLEPLVMDSHTCTRVIICVGCKCVTKEMRVFLDIFNHKMEALVRAKS
ncbi:MAG: hypothetical protein ACOVRN_12510 [Flavobacterium sp.]